jgi:hypothetical protein
VILTREQLSFRNIQRFADHLLSLSSPFVLAALIGVACVWTLERAPFQTMVNTARYFKVHCGQTLNLQVPVIVETQAHRAVYRTWLTDASGDVAYRYPDQEVPGAGRLDLSKHQINIPTFIKSGVYVLHVEVIYPFNPLKNGTILMSVATLTIN